MKKSELKTIIKEEIVNALNENVGDIIGYTALAIILGGSAYLTYMKSVAQHRISNAQMNPIVSQILSKVAPDWMRNREIKTIAHKLSKIPEVMEFVNSPNKLGIRNIISKHLNADEIQYLKHITRGSIKKYSELKEASPNAYLINEDLLREGATTKSALIESEQPYMWVKNGQIVNDKGMPMFPDKDNKGFKTLTDAHKWLKKKRYRGQLKWSSIYGDEHVVWENTKPLREVSPNAYLTKDFPSVIDYTNDRVGSEIKWNLISSEMISKQDIYNFQMKAGYHPAGYGGPFDYKQVKNQDGTFTYTWNCWSSSD